MTTSEGYEFGVIADSPEGWPEDLAATGVAGIISLGDLGLGDLKRATAAGLPVLGVLGNHCRRGDLEKAGAVNLVPQSVAALHQWGSAVVLAVEGCVRYKDGTNDVLYTQQQYAAVLDHIDVSIDIVITHCPPRGCNDHEDPAHHGIEALTGLVARCRPSLILHGHTYPEPPLNEFGGAQVRYVHGWGRIRLPV